MHRARDIVSGLRAVAVLLLVLSIVFGPIGLGSAIAAEAGPDPCGDSCPCDEDEEEHGDHDDCGDEESEPSDDECPDDCPSCGCGLSVALPFISPMMMPMPGPSTPALVIAPSDSAAAGVCSGVFRPPRSRI